MEKTLLERVKECKQKLGVSYKQMYKSCDIPVSVFYNFTGEIRDLPQKYIEKLQGYLEKLGY